MGDRSGEKTGWIGGWLGGFIWVVILAIIVLVQGKLLSGLIGLAIAGAAVAYVLVGAPWRHPDTPYWKLMLPVYVLFFVAIAWALWAADDVYSLALNRWHVFLLLPLLTPFWTTGRRRWSDSVPGGGQIDRP